MILIFYNLASYITDSEVEHFVTTRIASETKFRACTYNTVIVISMIFTAELLLFIISIVVAARSDTCQRLIVNIHWYLVQLPSLWLTCNKSGRPKTETIVGLCQICQHNLKHNRRALLCQHNGLKSDWYSLIEQSVHINTSYNIKRFNTL